MAGSIKTAINLPFREFKAQVRGHFGVPKVFLLILVLLFAVRKHLCWHQSRAIAASLVLVTLTTDLWWIRVDLFVLGLGVAGVFIPSQAISMATIPKTDTSNASPLFNAGKQLVNHRPHLRFRSLPLHHGKTTFCSKVIFRGSQLATIRPEDLYVRLR